MGSGTERSDYSRRVENTGCGDRHGDAGGARRQHLVEADGAEVEVFGTVAYDRSGMELRIAGQVPLLQLSISPHNS